MGLYVAGSLSAVSFWKGKKKMNVSLTINDLTPEQAAGILAKLEDKATDKKALKLKTKLEAEAAAAKKKAAAEVEDVEDDEDDEDVEDEKPKKAKRGRKAKKETKKPAKGKKGKGKGKKKAAEDLNFDDDDDEDDSVEYDADAVRTALVEYNQRNGKLATARLLQKFGAVNKKGNPDVAAIDEDDYAEIIAECNVDADLDD